MPPLRLVYIFAVGRCALVPHQVVGIEGVAYRGVEVLLVDEQVVVRSRQATLYKVAVNVRRTGLGNAAADIRFVVVVVIGWLIEVGGQHAEGLVVGFCRRCIDQQVLCLVAVHDAGQAVIVEEGWVEGALASG